MKIGILTFHSEINYGSVLQALALQTHLQSMGYDVQIIDKWEDPYNQRLWEVLSQKSPLVWLHTILRICFGLGDLGRIRRCIKSALFLRKYLRRTKYHFFKWNKAPRDLGLNLIVIGSDQVWNPAIVEPPDYLLRGLPEDIIGIAYAASFGCKKLASEWLEEYYAGFKRLKAISCRESEAVRLVEEAGFEAVHVVDPSLLVDSSCWNRFVDKKQYNRKLVVYNMDEIHWDTLKILIDFAKRNDVYVEYFHQQFPWISCPFSSTKLRNYLEQMRLIHNKRVHVRISASPDEFLKELSSATWVITNSFHGFMFSLVFRKNVRVVLPMSGFRVAMSSRLTEIADAFVKGPVLQPNFTDATNSLEASEHIKYNEENIEYCRKFSADWLKKEIESVAKR